MDWTTLTLPAWATTDEAQSFFYGLAIGATVRVFRVGVRWVKRIGNDTPSD